MQLVCTHTLPEIVTASLLVILLSGNTLNGQVFWLEDFATGIPADWTNQDATPNIDTLTNDTVRAVWQHCTNLLECSPVVNGFDAFAAGSAENGYVFVNSDVLGGNFSGTHLSQLTTGPIDCSDQEEVFLQFASQIGTFNFNAAENAVLRVRTEVGEEWQTFTIYPELQTGNGVVQISPNPETIILNLTAIAAGQDSLWLQWQWRGRFELFWALDDIQLSNTDPTPFPEDVVWYEDFGGSLDNWTVESIQPGNAFWEWYPTGDVSNGVLAPAGTRIESPTNDNGAAALNYDFIKTNGDPSNIPAFPFPDVIAELISPVIDLSEVEEPLNLTFYQLVNRLNAVGSTDYPFFSAYSISRDGGETWENPVDVNPDLQIQTSENSQRTFPLVDVQGEAEFRIKFTYAGDFFYWVLDDIALARRPANDLRIQTNFFAIPPNTMTPASQITAIPFWADVLNVGGQPQTNVHLDLSIIDDSTNTLAFQDAIVYGTLATDSLAENVIFSKTFTPPPISKEYRGTYFIFSDSSDFNPHDNAVNFRFAITDTTFAKEHGPTRSAAPSTTPNFTYGNVFYCPNGENWYARYLTFGVANASELLGKTVTTYLYEIEGDLDGDFNIEPSEMNTQPLAFNFYEFKGTEDNELLTIPIDLDEQTVPLQADTYYYVAVQYQTDDEERCFLLASDAQDYNATFFLSDTLGQAQYSSLLDVGNTGNYNVVGFGFDLVPVVRLHIGDNPDLGKPAITNTQQVTQAQDIQVFPNPATNKLWLKIDDFKNTTTFTVEIKGADGKIHMHRKINLAATDGRLELPELPSGIYFLYLHSEKIVGKATFIVIK